MSERSTAMMRAPGADAFQYFGDALGRNWTRKPNAGDSPRELGDLIGFQLFTWLNNINQTISDPCAIKALIHNGLRIIRYTFRLTRMFYGGTMTHAFRVRDVVLQLSGPEAELAQELLSRLRHVLPTVSGEKTAPEIPYEFQELASRLEASRKERRHFFDSSIFADPGWDMLLALYVARAKGEETCITSLTYSVDVPQTTGLRWIQVLEHRGLTCRDEHPTDRRRTIISLTPKGLRQLNLYFERIFRRHFDIVISQNS